MKNLIEELIKELEEKRIETATEIKGSEYEWESNSPMFDYQDKIDVIEEIMELLEQTKDKMEEM